MAGKSKMMPVLFKGAAIAKNVASLATTLSSCMEAKSPESLTWQDALQKVLHMPGCFDLALLKDGPLSEAFMSRLSAHPTPPPGEEGPSANAVLTTLQDAVSERLMELLAEAEPLRQELLAKPPLQITDLPEGLRTTRAISMDAALWHSLGHRMNPTTCPMLAEKVLCERLAIQATVEQDALRQALIALHVLDNLEEYLKWELSFPASCPAKSSAEVLAPFDAATSREVALRRVLSEALPEPEVLVSVVGACFEADVAGASIPDALLAWAATAQAPRSSATLRKTSAAAPSAESKGKVQTKKTNKKSEAKRIPDPKDASTAQAGYGSTVVKASPPLLQESFSITDAPELRSLQCTSFTIHPSLLATPLGDLVVLNAVLVKVDNSDAAGIWKQRFQQTWKAKQDTGLDLKTDKAAVAFDEFVKASGVLPSTKKKPQSCLAMLKRCYAGSPPFSVSPMVDFYNSLSVSNCVACGGFDLGDLSGDLVLRLSEDGDMFRAFDAEVADSIPAGEVTYAVGQTVVTRHLAYKQSSIGILKASSSAVFLQFELHPWMLEAGLHHELEAGLRDYPTSHAEASDVIVKIGYTSKEQPCWTWLAED